MTTLNLKNARRLEQSLEQHISSSANEQRTGLTVSAYQDYENVIADAGRDAFIAVTKLEALIDIRYRIRDMIAKANASCGINDLMVEEASIRSKLEVFTRFAKGEVLTDDRRDAIIQRLKNWDGTTSLSDSYSSRNKDEIKIESVMTEGVRDEAKSMVRGWKKRITAIADECSALNVTTVITIDDADSTVLNELDLL